MHDIENMRTSIMLMRTVLAPKIKILSRGDHSRGHDWRDRWQMHQAVLGMLCEMIDAKRQMVPRFSSEESWR